MNDNIIICNNLSKTFRWHERGLSLKENFIRAIKKPVKKYQWPVLKDINLNVNSGERIGIIGKNGSGKTTLLKLFAGIYIPSKGSVSIYSKRLLALIELGVGFYPQLSGKENIYINWALNGLPKKELGSKFNKIVEFAGLEKFINTPLKYYSSGMQARLGFSIAVNAKPDLLIIDEILAVGDADFQNKCYEEIERLCGNGLTIVFVSHNYEDIKRICNRVIWLKDGIIYEDGLPDKVINNYKSETMYAAT